jgi:hypothetical protein
LLLAALLHFSAQSAAQDPVEPVPAASPQAAAPAAPSAPPESTPQTAPTPQAGSIPPAEPTSQAGAVPPAEATPPATSAPVQEAAGPPGILILPAEFTVFQHGAASLEPVPNWTEDARRNLADSARRVLTADGRFRLIETPKISADQDAVMTEHIELFKIIGSQFESVVKVGGKAWEETRKSADYRIGPGLQFLRELTGADFAFLLAGAEIRQTGGSIFMQLLAASAGVYVPGGGTYMYAGIINLQTGRITWYGSHQGQQLLGMGGADARSGAGADAALQQIIKSYPRTVGLDLGSGMAQ